MAQTIQKPKKTAGSSSGQQNLESFVKGKFALAYNLSRSAHFAVQQFTLPLLEKIFTGKSRPLNEERIEQLKAAYGDLFALLKKDAKNIEDGLYPLAVLKPEPLTEHLKRFPRILFDGYSIAKRRQNQKAHDFTEKEKEFFKDIPEYAARNYHFQTGGYLSDHSASLYEHQVEILFSGAADAMRRLLLPLLKEKFPGDGDGLRFLEVAAGTGRLSRFVKLIYPKATLTVTDMSHPYLKKAQENLKEFSRVEYLQANAENLPFKDETFDLVFSCFLFHEVPLKARAEVLNEGRRVLKPGGLYGIVDSIQNVDSQGFAWALESFPVDFHEPFYKAYVQNPLEASLEKASLTLHSQDQGFFSKALLAEKLDKQA